MPQMPRVPRDMCDGDVAGQRVHGAAQAFEELDIVDLLGVLVGVAEPALVSPLGMVGKVWRQRSTQSRASLLRRLECVKRHRNENDYCM